MKDVVQSHLEGGAQRAGGGPAELVEQVRREPELLGRVVAGLDSPDPRVRGGAAGVLAALATEAADLLPPHVPAMVTALEHEEHPTRVGIYQALAALAGAHPESLDDDFDVIRLGLFDPLQADIRSHAALAVARFGTRDAASGRRAFPHLAEALRRFHDSPRAAGLIEGLLVLARGTNDDALRKDIWRTVRRHERHADPAVRSGVEEIGTLAR